MTKAHAYAYEAGYQDGLKAAADELQDENDRMRKLVERLFVRLLELLDENDELQELVHDMWPFVKAGSAHTCPNRECCLFEDCDAGSEGECPIDDRMAARMRELGIEVDEC